VAVFDRLSQGQKQVAILTVGNALLDVGTDPPPVNAILAGTVDAIYRDRQARIETEISFEEPTVRKMVLEAMDEMEYWTDVNSSLEPDEEPAEPLSPDSADCAAWSDLVESLRTEILEDYDFDMEAKFLDMAPAAAAELKKQLNIDPDYFVGVIEDRRHRALKRFGTSCRRCSRSPGQGSVPEGSGRRRR
jgi:hypothetical protein